MTLHSMDICPCILWLEAYNRLGNKLFYEKEHEKHDVCVPCKIHTVGHNPGWCENEFCKE